MRCKADDVPYVLAPSVDLQIHLLAKRRCQNTRGEMSTVGLGEKGRGSTDRRGFLLVPATRPTALLSWGRKVTVLVRRRRQSSGKGIGGDSSDGIYLKARKHCFRGKVRLIFY